MRNQYKLLDDNEKITEEYVDNNNDPILKYIPVNRVRISDNLGGYCPDTEKLVLEYEDQYPPEYDPDEWYAEDYMLTLLIFMVVIGCMRRLCPG